MSNTDTASKNSNNDLMPTITPSGNMVSAGKIIRLSPRIFQDIIAIAEFCLIIVASLAAKFIYIDIYLGNAEPVAKYVVPTFAGAALTIYVFTKRKLYDQATLIDVPKSLPTIISSVGLALLLLIAIGYATKFGQQYSRGWLMTWALMTAVGLMVGRLITAWVYRQALQSGYFCKRIAILGNGEMLDKLRNHIEESVVGAHLVGVFDDDIQTANPHHLESDLRDNPTIKGCTKELIKLGQQNRIDEVIVASSGPTDSRLLSVIDKLRILPVVVMICPSEVTQKISIKDVEHFGSVTLLKVQKKPINEWGYFMKSLCDYVCSFLGLVILSPLLLLIALAVKLTSKGPVFFSQKRHGYNHKVINVLKFRTMTVMENGHGVVQAKENDARFTVIGGFLRKTSLDELPQLINVLKGDMSLVGPRPHALTHNHYYSEMLEQYANRHRVKPGITGLAQVSGFRGPTEDLELMRSRVDHDLEYIDNWTFWLDIKILFATINVVFNGENAI